MSVKAGVKAPVSAVGAQQEAQQQPRTIFEAAEKGAVGFITRLIERSLEFNINQRDKFQRTALHWAAEAGSVEAAECLIDYGIDTSAIECNGRTAVHLAARSGHTDVIRTLLEGKTDLEREQFANQPDFFGLTPVFLALQRGEQSREAFDYLMSECGGHYNQTFKHKSDPVT